MFDRIGKLAEKTAAGLSRRAFLTRVGLAAMALTAFATGARAGPHIVSCVLNGGCCSGQSPYFGTNSLGHHFCYLDARCRTKILCAPTSCCNSNPKSACVAGTICFSDNGCQNRC